MNGNENKNLIISKKELEDLQEMFKERDEIKAKLDMTELNLKRKILATHKRKLKKVILEIENAQNKLEKLENEFKNTIRLYASMANEEDSSLEINSLVIGKKVIEKNPDNFFLFNILNRNRHYGYGTLDDYEDETSKAIMCQIISPDSNKSLENLRKEMINTIRYIKTLKREISELCQIYGHEWHFENIATREFHWHFDGFDCQYKCVFCGKEENVIVNDISTIKDYHNPSEVLSKKALDFQLEDYINIYTKTLKK